MNPVKTYTDPELVHLLKQKDPDACDFLFRKYAGAVNGVISQSIPSTGSTEKLLEDSFVNIFNHLHEYDPKKGRLFTWILGMIRQTAIKKINNGNEPASPGSFNSEQQMILHTYFSGQSMNVVAEKMNLPVHDVLGKIKNALLRVN